MNKEIIKQLQTYNVEQFKTILNNEKFNIFKFENFSFVNLIQLNDIDKFSLLYNDKRAKELINNPDIILEAIKLNNLDVIKLLLKNRSIINYLNRSSSNILSNMEIDNPEIIEVILKSDITFSEKDIEKITVFFIINNHINSFRAIIEDENCSHIFNSNDCWIALANAENEILKSYCKNHNFKYLNNKLIAKCYKNNDTEKTKYLLSFKRKGEDFIKFVIENRNKRYINQKNTNNVFKKLLKDKNFISQLNKNLIKKFRNEEDKKDVYFAMQSFKITNF